MRGYQEAIVHLLQSFGDHVLARGDALLDDLKSAKAGADFHVAHRDFVIVSDHRDLGLSLGLK
jgi:hypothetical protein